MVVVLFLRVATGIVLGFLREERDEYLELLDKYDHLVKRYD